VGLWCVFEHQQIRIWGHPEEQVSARYGGVSSVGRCPHGVSSALAQAEEQPLTIASHVSSYLFALPSEVARFSFWTSDPLRLEPSWELRAGNFLVFFCLYPLRGNLLLEHLLHLDGFRDLLGVPQRRGHALRPTPVREGSLAGVGGM
jgi:hypothetical protein